MLVDQGQHGLDARCGLRLLDGMNGGPLAPAIVGRDLPYRGRELERDSEHRFFSLRLISCKSTFSALISRSRSSSTTAQIVAAVSYIGQGLAEFVNRFRAHLESESGRHGSMQYCPPLGEMFPVDRYRRPTDQPAICRTVLQDEQERSQRCEAIVEAASRPTMCFVTIKSVEQQDIQAAHRMRAIFCATERR